MNTGLVLSGDWVYTFGINTTGVDLTMKKWKSKLFAILMAVCMIVGSTGAISTMPVFAATN